MSLSRYSAHAITAPATPLALRAHAAKNNKSLQNAHSSSVASRGLFTAPPVPYEPHVNAVFREEEDRSERGVRLVSFLGRWKGGNDDLKKLVWNKHYQHALDYFAIMSEHGPQPDLKSYNLLFQVYEKIGTPLDVIEGFKAMQDRGILPDVESYSWVIKAYCMGDFLKSALGMLDKQKKLGTPDAKTYAVLLDLAVKLKKMDIAESLVKEVSTNPNIKPHVEFQNALIRYHGTLGDNDMALKIFSETLSSESTRFNYNTFQRLLDLLIAANDVKKVIELVGTMVERHYIPNLYRTKYALLAFYAKSGDPRLLSLLDNTYHREVWEKDGHVKYYRSFLIKYIESLAASDEEREHRVHVEQVLKSNNVNDLEDAYIDILGRATEGVEWEPQFDRYGDVEKVIDTVATQRTDWTNKEETEYLHPDYAKQAEANGTVDQMQEGNNDGDEDGVADLDWPNFSIMKTDEEAAAAYRKYVLSHPEHKTFPPERLNTGHRSIELGDKEGMVPPHPELDAMDLFERFRARKAAETGVLSVEASRKAKAAEKGAFKDQGGYKDTERVEGEGKGEGVDPETRARINDLTEQYHASLSHYDPYDPASPTSQSSTAFEREERRFKRDDGPSPEDEYERALEARLETLRTKDPKRYERLYRQYRFEVHGETDLRDEDIDMVKNNPLKALMGQVLAVDDLAPKNQSEEQEVVNTAYRTFNYDKGPDVRFRRMMAVYVSQKMARGLKAKEAERQKREW